ncbi:FAD/NAD(P)-binding protein [Aquimarina sp. M1]
MVDMNNYKSLLSSVYNVGIIGLGPKGLYALERLLAQIKSRNIQIPIAIHIFNQNPFFGPGNVYRNDQAPYLIMNYANKNIDIWSRELPEPIVKETPDFTEWLVKKTGTPTEKLIDGFASRAMVGSYLMESFTRLCENAPLNVKITTHVTTIQKIAKRDGRIRLHSTCKETHHPITFDTLMLTTGHLSNGAHFDTKKLSESYIEFIYPVSQKLSHIEADAKVAIRGFGLTGIDAILALTEGSGGRFESNTNGTLSYTASGKEPRAIFPFSRTGLPMVPRGTDSSDSNPLRFFTEKTVLEFRDKPYISFPEDILPLIKREVTFNYYKVIFKKYRRRLNFSSDYNTIDRQIAQFHNTFPSEKRFDWEAFINPFPSQKTLSHKDIYGYVKLLIDEAEKGLDNSPIMAAAGTWRQISPVFNILYSYAGLDAASHHLFDTTYFGLFNRIAYGPPIINMKKIMALAEAGIVDFSFIRSPKISMFTEDDFTRYKLSNGRKKIEVDYLINARVPRNETRNENSLYANLLKEGLVCKYINTNNGHYKPGCVAIDFKGRPLSKDGNIQKNITLYGTPTEGVTFDNDTLSRKRNNFASQWAHDISEQLDKILKNSLLENEKQHQI